MMMKLHYLKAIQCQPCVCSSIHSGVSLHIHTLHAVRLFCVTYQQPGYDSRNVTQRCLSFYLYFIFSILMSHPRAGLAVWRQGLIQPSPSSTVVVKSRTFVVVYFNKNTSILKMHHNKQSRHTCRADGRVNSMVAFCLPMGNRDDGGRTYIRTSVADDHSRCRKFLNCQCRLQAFYCVVVVRVSVCVNCRLTASAVENFRFPR